MDDGDAQEVHADHDVCDGVLVDGGLDGVDQQDPLVDPLVDQAEDISHGAGTQAVNNVHCTPLGTAHDTEIELEQSPSKRRRLAHRDGDGEGVEVQGADGGGDVQPHVDGHGGAQGRDGAAMLVRRNGKVRKAKRDGLLQLAISNFTVQKNENDNFGGGGERGHSVKLQTGFTGADNSEDGRHRPPN